jgi:hypothetical protein
VLWVFSVTFFAFDWVMSLEPLWYSDVFGLVFGASIVLPAMALVLLASELASLGQEEPMVSRLQDYANLLLAVVLGWVFFDFSQYLIIWMGNLPHEIDWFVHRSSGGWRVIAIAILVLLFIAPTVLLLSRRVKRSRPMLMLLSAVILVGHYLNCWWLVIPTFHPDRLALDWSAAAAWLGIGGVALSVFLGHLATFREAGTEHAGTATSRNAEASP